MNVSTKTKRTVDHKLNELESSTCSSNSYMEGLGRATIK